MPRLKPGDLLQPTAAEWNRMQDVAEWYARTKSRGDARQPRQGTYDLNLLEVKNLTGERVRRGEVMEFGGFALGDSEISQGTLWFQGITPDLLRNNEHYRTGFAVACRIIPNGDIDTCYLTGPCPALVNVTDANHRFATLKAGSRVLQSSPFGATRILYKPSGTGEKECAVLLAAPQQYPVVQFSTFGYSPPGVNNSISYAPFGIKEFDNTDPPETYSPSTGGIAIGRNISSGYDDTIEIVADVDAQPFRVSWSAYSYWQMPGPTAGYFAKIQLDSPNGADVWTIQTNHNQMPTGVAGSEAVQYSEGATGTVSGSDSYVMRLTKGDKLQVRSDVVLSSGTPQTHRCYARLIIEPMFMF